VATCLYMHYPGSKFGIVLLGCVTFNHVGFLAFVDGTIVYNVNASKANTTYHVFQDDNAPIYRARTVVEYKLKTFVTALWLQWNTDSMR